MKRCNRCVLPYNYPMLTFDENGICSHCLSHQEINYLGSEALEHQIRSFLEQRKDRSSTFDCILGFSGGRDSTYLLYYLTRQLGFRVLAYTSDNGSLIPSQTRLNIQRVSKKLDSTIFWEKNKLIHDCFRHTLSSWIHRPSLAMVEAICTGCRVGIFRGIIRCASKHRIPVIVTGGTPFENPSYRVNLWKGCIRAYVSEIIRNPKWLTSYKYLRTQVLEYHYFINFPKRIKKSTLKISPFWYIRWNENEVVLTIQRELGWSEIPESDSTWRSDCELATLKRYIYKYVLGFNDEDDHLSHLIRDNQISREEALKRLSTKKISEDVIIDFFKRNNLNYSKFDNCLQKLKKEWNQQLSTI